MRKAIMINHPESDYKVYASEFLITVKHKGKKPIEVHCTNYTYEDAFEYLKEQYEFNLDYIEKVTIEVLR